VHAWSTRRHPTPFTVEDLLPYRTAETEVQQEALKRRRIMRKANEEEAAVTPADLERRYREAPISTTCEVVNVLPSLPGWRGAAL